jgi:hypothetical protein
MEVNEWTLHNAIRCSNETALTMLDLDFMCQRMSPVAHEVFERRHDHHTPGDLHLSHIQSSISHYTHSIPYYSP